MGYGVSGGQEGCHRLFQLKLEIILKQFITSWKGKWGLGPAFTPIYILPEYIMITGPFWSNDYDYILIFCSTL